MSKLTQHNDRDLSFEDALKKLTTRKQRQFVLQYLSNGFNGAAAARAAGYAVESDRTIAAQNLAKSNIKAAIEAGMRETCISAPEVVARLTAMARGTVEPFLDDSGALNMNTEAARASLHLVRKYKQIPTELGVREEIELHDPKDALKVLANYHGLLEQRVSVTVDESSAQKARQLLGMKVDDAAD